MPSPELHHHQPDHHDDDDHHAPGLTPEVQAHFQHVYQYGYPPPPAVPPAAPRPARYLFYLSIVRPWAMAVPLVAIVMDVWWFSTGRLCGYTNDIGDKCFWMLWSSLPLAFVSLAWNLATTISSRRLNNGRHGITSSYQLVFQAGMATGAAISLAVLAWYSAGWPWHWNSHLQGAVIALVAIITLVNWLLVGFAAYEWQLDKRYHEQRAEEIAMR